MSRALRRDQPDGAFHAIGRAVDGAFLFRDDDDRRCFLGILAQVVRRCGWEVHALCLMGTHYHLVLAALRQELSQGMHCLNGRYADAFNRRYARRGHLFGDRFVSRVIDDERQLRAVCRYVVGNPVRAGLVADVEAWPWTHSRYGVAEAADAG